MVRWGDVDFALSQHQSVRSSFYNVKTFSLHQDEILQGLNIQQI